LALRGVHGGGRFGWWVMAGKSSRYDRDDATPGAGIDHQQAADALRRLRLESRREERPYRAATLAEAEGLRELRDPAATSAAVLREHGLTVKSPATVRRGGWNRGD
jgi:hypothetical protein